MPVIVQTISQLSRPALLLYPKIWSKQDKMLTLHAYYWASYVLKTIQSEQLYKNYPYYYGLNVIPCICIFVPKVTLPKLAYQHLIYV